MVSNVDFTHTCCSMYQHHAVQKVDDIGVLHRSSVKEGFKVIASVGKMWIMPTASFLQAGRHIDKQSNM